MNLDGRRAGGMDLNSGLHTAGTWWRCTWRRSEARCVNLDGGHTGGMDVDSGLTVEAHVEEE
jgi:hypothetical protein